MVPPVLPPRCNITQLSALGKIHAPIDKEFVKLNPGLSGTKTVLGFPAKLKA